MFHSPIQSVVFCLMTASLAITYRRYLIQDGGLLAWWPGLFYKIMPVSYDKWSGVHKAAEKILITCATCQAGQLAFWATLCDGFSMTYSLLCAGLSSVIAHIVDQKYFAQ
jgi:hypothetical protein